MGRVAGIRDRDRGWRPLVVFVASGLLGGTVAAALAAATMPGPVSVNVSPFPFLVFGAALAGGVVSGWFVAILVLAHPRGGVHCPRCGTPNTRGFTVCRACGLG
ncbi:MAG: hypothetical protein A2Z48_03775 [Actinobacteria bacterium RBG_19FT_COMBO_70_19]|nr:MAG: hypothetical protein A2Z48_03775 [Actinobacteria bacterium RBG_19FT_COMBO_70_19]